MRSRLSLLGFAAASIILLSALDRASAATQGGDAPASAGMDRLTFVAKLFEHGAWPACVVIIAMIFRARLDGLLAKITKGKVAGVEVTFGESVAKAEAEAAAANQMGADKEGRSASNSASQFKAKEHPLNTWATRLGNLIIERDKHSPASQVRLGWEYVQSAISFVMIPNPVVRTVSFVESYQHLVPAELRERYAKLRDLTAYAYDTRRVEQITDAGAREFLLLAIDFLKALSVHLDAERASVQLVPEDGPRKQVS